MKPTKSKEMEPAYAVEMKDFSTSEEFTEIIQTLEEELMENDPTLTDPLVGWDFNCSSWYEGSNAQNKSG